MQLLATTALVLLAGILVVFAPGACMLALWRLDRVVPPPLVPAAALALSLVSIAAITAATLVLHQPIEVAAGVLGVGLLLGWSRLAGRARDERRGEQRFSRARVRVNVRDWLAPLRWLAAGDWLRGTPALALVLAALGAVLAWLVGFHAWNDSLYHIGQVQKLLALDAPSLTNTLQFTDGSAHPGYLLPTWHEAMALVAFASRQDPVTVAWMLPALTFATSMLAFGGLAWSFARARGAAIVGAAAVLVLNVAGLPYSDAIINSMQPGVLALGVLAPLVLAMLLTALWPEPAGGRDPDSISPRTTTRAATFLAVMATALLGNLHVSYLWVLGMGIAGYYLLWALRSPWPREVVRRHLLVGLSIAVIAATVIALLYPGLSRLEGVGRDAATELQANDSAQYEGENAANLDLLLRGDPAGDFHLRNDYLIQLGGLALLGIVGMAIPLLRPRWPGGWQLWGAGLLVLAIAQSDRLFPAFVDVVTLDQARRIERVLPHALGLTTLALAIAMVVDHLWRAGSSRRAAAASVGVAATAATALVVDGVPALGGYGGDQIVSPRVLLGLGAILALGALWQAALLVRRIASRRPDDQPATWWPGERIDTRVTLVALAVLVVGSTPAWDGVSRTIDSSRLDQVPVDMRGAELRLFSSRVATKLRDLPTGSVVLADPRSRNPYTAMAIAPVYVVSSVPRHTALTPENRVTERFDLAVEFFDDATSPARRLQILDEANVDAVLVHPAAAGAARRQLEALAGVTVAATGKNQRLYVIDPARMAAGGAVSFTAG